MIGGSSAGRVASGYLPRPAYPFAGVRPKTCPGRWTCPGAVSPAPSLSMAGSMSPLPAAPPKTACMSFVSRPPPASNSGTASSGPREARSATPRHARRLPPPWATGSASSPCSPAAICFASTVTACCGGAGPWPRITRPSPTRSGWRPRPSCTRILSSWQWKTRASHSRPALISAPGRTDGKSRVPESPTG